MKCRWDFFWCFLAFFLELELPDETHDFKIYQFGSFDWKPLIWYSCCVYFHQEKRKTRVDPIQRLGFVFWCFAQVKFKIHDDLLLVGSRLAALLLSASTGQFKRPVPHLENEITVFDGKGYFSYQIILLWGMFPLHCLRILWHRPTHHNSQYSSREAHQSQCVKTAFNSWVLLFWD